MNYKEYTVKVYDRGDRYWYLHGKLHREDGPAEEWADGTELWHLNGKRHREDGPAEEYTDGTKSWFLNGELHREDGPAVEQADGTKLWFLNGKELTEEEFIRRTAKGDPCEGRVVEIDGKKYKLVPTKQ